MGIGSPSTHSTPSTHRPTSISDLTNFRLILVRTAFNCSGARANYKHKVTSGGGLGGSTPLAKELMCDDLHSGCRFAPFCMFHCYPLRRRFNRDYAVVDR